MGLDQYLYHSIPDPLDPNSRGTELAYWRKDWQLQNFLGTDNCEAIVITADICRDVLSNLKSIYENDKSYLPYTKQAFTQALNLIAQGKRIIYEADW